MKAIIMAGGAGSRLRPLTCGRPKPIVPIMNKAVMGRIIELLKRNGITDIGVTLQFLPEKIEDMFGDGSEMGVNIKYFIEDSPLGTAGSGGRGARLTAAGAELPGGTARRAGLAYARLAVAAGGDAVAAVA